MTTIQLPLGSGFGVGGRHIFSLVSHRGFVVYHSRAMKLTEIEIEDLYKQLSHVSNVAERIECEGRAHDAQMIRGLCNRVRAWVPEAAPAPPAAVPAASPAAPKKRRGRPPKRAAQPESEPLLQAAE